MSESRAPDYTRFTIRPLVTLAERDACVELQRETWGRTFSDVVPASVLMIAERIGGVAAGAFASDDRLVGFVFGLTGIEHGTLVHWSDMLAVRADARNCGVGRALKEYQRVQLLRRGVERMYWTYDPLVARNAHLNFDVLGARAVEYVVDMYGTTGSELHAGIGTDRFVVAWDLAAPRTRDGAERGADVTVEQRIEIPLDIHAVQLSDPAEAAAWRARTRPQFQRAMADGMTVVRIDIDERARRAYYLLARSAARPPEPASPV
jgi:predicted GNAT superfamily acetyltransferase